MPKEPVISIQELVRSWTAGVNQRRKPVSGAIRQALTPTPHSTRAASSQPKLVASAKAAQPEHGQRQEAQDHLARAVAVQPGAQRQLDRGEAQEVAAGQQAEVAARPARTPASARATAWP